MLPKPENCNAAKAEPRRREERVPDPIALPNTVHGVRGLMIELVETDEQRMVWNTLLHFEHPRRTTTFVGAQVRYLVFARKVWSCERLLAEWGAGIRIGDRNDKSARIFRR